MVDVTMPKLSMNMSDGEVVEWYVEDGDDVEAGADLGLVESEKATAEVDAPAAGAIAIAVPAGERVEVGAVLATIGEGAAEGPDLESRASDGASDQSADSGRGGGPVRATPSARSAAREHEVSIEDVARSLGTARVALEDVEAYRGDRPDDRGTPPASPAARRAAREAGVDLAAVAGSGPGGAVVLADLEAPGAAGAPPAAGSSVPAADVRERRPLDTGVRGVIARRMTESWREAPHVTVDRDVRAARAMELADSLDDELEVAVSFDDVLLAAVGETLLAHPAFNGTVEGDEHVLRADVNVAVAVDTERGLVAPVLHGVDAMSFEELAAERWALVERTRDGSVEPDRLAGGTFTVSNLGPLGARSFTPLINPPQVAILGVSTVRREAVPADDGAVGFADVMTTSLSFDHRAVDGADAARFLRTLDDVLNDPLSSVV